MSDPTFQLDEDGEHVWWSHDCPAHHVDFPVACKIPLADESQYMLPRGKEKCWTVVQREPLTVVPSILCHGCGCHGFITNGAWVPV